MCYLVRWNFIVGILKKNNACMSHIISVRLFLIVPCLTLNIKENLSHVKLAEARPKTKKCSSKTRVFDNR